MEPRALSNLNGSLVPVAEVSTKHETPAKPVSGYQLTSPDNRLSFGASSRRESIRVSLGPEALAEAIHEEEQPQPPTFKVPSTPASALAAFDGEIGTTDFSADDLTTSSGSPTTPYFLSKGAALVQQTCPPKQSMQSLFPVSGRIEDQPDEDVRRRLVMARRKSLQWAPKVGSPLGRAVSYGKP